MPFKCSKLLGKSHLQALLRHEHWPAGFLQNFNLQAFVLREAIRDFDWQSVLLLQVIRSYSQQGLGSSRIYKTLCCVPIYVGMQQVLVD